MRHVWQVEVIEGIRDQLAESGGWLLAGTASAARRHRARLHVEEKTCDHSLRGKTVSSTAAASRNVTAVIPLLLVTDMERSLTFYIDGLRFTVQNRWVPDGHLRWCRMSLGGAALMLQEASDSTRSEMRASGTLGNGAALYFQCTDAIAVYREAVTRGIHPRREPQVGNNAWEVFFADPDGYHINFSSPIDLPDETLLSQIKT